METQAQEQTAPPARSQAAETQRRRRRRDDFGELRNLKLAVPESLKDPNYEYRWITDTTGGRVQQMTVEDDWDLVSSEEIKGQGEGTTVARHVGTSDEHKPQRAYLVRKPKEFHKEDQAAKWARLAQSEKDLMRGPAKTEDGLPATEAYVPEGAQNRISRGS